MNGQITASAEVRHLLGEGQLALLAQQAATGYRCLACGQWGELGGEPVTVIVMIKDAAGVSGGAGQVDHVRLAHQRCSPSQVIHDADSFSVAEWGGMMATAVVLPAAQGPRPLLITETDERMVSLAGGDSGELGVSVLLGEGLHLMADIWVQAPASPGWLARVGPRHQVEVVYPGGGVHFAGELDLPWQWRLLVTARSEVELLSGVVGFSGDDMTPQEALEVLTETARQGRLVAGRIRVEHQRRSWRGLLSRRTRSEG